MLDFAVLSQKEESFTKTLDVFNVVKAIEEVHSILISKLQLKSITFEKECAADIYVRTDRQRLIQVILNLVANAIKYTKNDGKITVAANLIGNKLMVSVKDNGVGIQQEKMSSLFKLFGSIKNEKEQVNTQGIGLGLTTCKMIVEKFNGEINVQTMF